MKKNMMKKKNMAPCYEKDINYVSMGLKMIPIKDKQF